MREMDTHDMKGRVIIDLEQYGGKGQIEMSAPRFSRKNELANALTKYVSMTGDKPVLNDVSFGDMDIMSTLAYVSKAPFYIGLDKGTVPFLEFMDSLDESGSDNADRLWSEIQISAGRIINGETHPLH